MDVDHLKEEEYNLVNASFFLLFRRYLVNNKKLVKN